MSAHRFTDEEIAGVYRAIHERRDMRHFSSQALEKEQLARFIEAAHKAPSVGFMQPWRFIRIVNANIRAELHRLVDEERKLTADALGARRDEFMKLKDPADLAKLTKKVGEALKATEADKHSSGKTFGEVIKAGKLPGEK